jgi:hypothetical protein
VSLTFGDAIGFSSRANAFMPDPGLLNVGRLFNFQGGSTYLICMVYRNKVSTSMRKWGVLGNTLRDAAFQHSHDQDNVLRKQP